MPGTQWRGHVHGLQSYGVWDQAARPPPGPFHVLVPRPGHPSQPLLSADRSQTSPEHLHQCPPHPTHTGLRLGP